MTTVVGPLDGSDDFTWAGQNGGAQGVWTEYTWLVVMGGLFAFGTAWAIGANDVANAFGTSVGAKTLKLWQACIIAAIFEFTGAITLGDQVTRTVAGSITSPAFFENDPQVFAYGMLCALLSAMLWVCTATYLELAVSTTHSIIGAIIGFGLVYGGRDAIIWAKSIDTFPFVEGLIPVVISWFTSPIIAAVSAGLLFLLNRHLILRRENSHILAFIALPVLILITIWVDVFFVLYKGAAEHNWTVGKMSWISAIVAGGCAAVSIPIIIVLKRRHQVQLEKFKNAHEQVPEMAKDSKDWAAPVVPTTIWARIKARLLYSLTVDVHEDVYRDLRVAAMHSAAEVFDPKAEEVYKYLQVFSSCCVSFAHGSNDVANAIAPFAAIWYVYNNHAVSSSVQVPRWIMVLGGAGIVIGLATYGYNIIKVLGVKMAKMTPSRGYCAELATAFTVAFASVYGLPVSTTHSIVGAELGVGVMEGIKEGANWVLFAKTVVAWVFTLAITGIISAAIFAFGTNTPSLTTLRVAADYRDIMIATSERMVAQLNATNYGNKATNGHFDEHLDAVLNRATNNLSILAKGPQNKHLMVPVFNTTINIYMARTIPVVGYNKTLATNNTGELVLPAINATQSG